MTETLEIYQYEKKYSDNGFVNVVGIDEVGRGPLAGPVVAAAVILPIGLIIEGLNDSKKLSEKKRTALDVFIRENAIAYNIAAESIETIDEINIRNATIKCMQKAVEGLNVKPDACLVDGNFYPFDIPGECIVKGDSKSASIMAASIIAKVYRDQMMVAFDELYPMYRFAKNKGYGTMEHINAIHEFGLCEIHRRSFVRGIVNGEKKG